MAIGLVIKKIIKYGLSQVYSVIFAILRWFGLIDFSVPPHFIMRKTSGKTLRHFYISGIQTSLPIATCALCENIKLNAHIRILDFGCGGGRQLLHFTRHFQNPYYFACDIDDTAITFIKIKTPIALAPRM